MDKNISKNTKPLIQDKDKAKSIQSSSTSIKKKDINSNASRITTALWFHNLLLTLLIAAGLIFSLFNVSDEDIWWHIKTGQWIVENKSLPWKEPFTFTVPKETIWYDTQWFFQVIAERVYKLGGWNAIICIRVLWVCALVIGVWLWLKERNIPVLFNFFSVLLVIINCRYRFNTRPELLTFALFAFQLWLYDKSRKNKKINMLPLIISQFLWANWHSSSLLGIFLACMFFADQIFLRNYLKDRRSLSSLIPIKQFKIFLPLLFLVTLLNPNGWLAPLLAVTEGKKSYILEFQSPSLGFFIGTSGLVLIISIFGWKNLFDRKSIFLLMIVPVFFIQSLRMFRFFPYLAICIAPLQAEGLKVIYNKILNLKKIYVKMPIFLCLTFFILSAAAFNIKNDEKPIFTFGVDESKFPVKAVDFILKENIKGNLYNEFGNGGYLVWRLFPERKVFIFGETRLNAPLLEQTMTIYDINDWRALFADYQIDYAIFNCACIPLRTSGSTLPYLTFSWKEWKLVFWDDTSMVFVKNTPENKELINHRSCQILPEIIPYRDNPVTDIAALEMLLKDSAKWNDLEKELLRVIEESPRHFRAALALAILRIIRNENPQSILEAFNKAEKIDPRLPELHQYIAVYYLNIGNYEKAIEYTKKAMKNGLSKKDGLYKIAFILYKAGKYPDALLTIDRFLKIQPDNEVALKLKQDILYNMTKK